MDYEMAWKELKDELDSLLDAMAWAKGRVLKNNPNHVNETQDGKWSAYQEVFNFMDLMEKKHKEDKMTGTLNEKGII